MLKDNKDMESLIQRLQAELATENTHAAEKNDTKTYLSTEFNILCSSMKEFFGKANLTNNFDAKIIGKDSLKENKGQFHQIEDMLNTSKVFCYSID